MLEMELPGKRKRRRPQKIFMDGLKEDMQRVGVTDRVKWRPTICCGDPYMEQPTEKEEAVTQLMNANNTTSC